MPDRYKIPEGVNVVKDDTGYSVYYRSTYLYHHTNALEARRWAAQDGECILWWRMWLNRDTHMWNGVQQL